MGQQYSRKILERIQCKVRQKFTVGFQMNNSIRCQYILINLKESWASKTPLGIPYLWTRIWKSDPYFIYFLGSKVAFQLLSLYPKKSCILQILFYRPSAAHPEPIPFYIYSNKVLFRKPCSQPHRVFALPTS